MANIQGDATQEDIDKEILAELKARIASGSDTNPVTLTVAQATRLFEMAGGSWEEEEDKDKEPKGPA